MKNYSDQDIDCRVQIDGVEMGGFLVETRSSLGVKGIVVSSSELRPFMFKSLQVTGMCNFCHCLCDMRNDWLVLQMMTTLSGRRKLCLTSWVQYKWISSDAE